MAKERLDASMATASWTMRLEVGGRNLPVGGCWCRNPYAKRIPQYPSVSDGGQRSGKPPDS